MEKALKILLRKYAKGFFREANSIKQKKKVTVEKYSREFALDLWSHEANILMSTSYQNYSRVEIYWHFS